MQCVEGFHYSSQCFPRDFDISYAVLGSYYGMAMTRPQRRIDFPVGVRESYLAEEDGSASVTHPHSKERSTAIPETVEKEKLSPNIVYNQGLRSDVTSFGAEAVEAQLLVVCTYRGSTRTLDNTATT